MPTTRTSHNTQYEWECTFMRRGYLRLECTQLVQTSIHLIQHKRVPGCKSGDHNNCHQQRDYTPQFRACSMCSRMKKSTMLQGACNHDMVIFECAPIVTHEHCSDAFLQSKDNASWAVMRATCKLPDNTGDCHWSAQWVLAYLRSVHAFRLHMAAKVTEAPKDPQMFSLSLCHSLTCWSISAVGGILSKLTFHRCYFFSILQDCRKTNAISCPQFQ